MGGWRARMAACLARGGAAAGGTSRRAASPAQAETMPTTAPGSVPAELDPSLAGQAASPAASGRAAFPVRAPVTAVCGQLHFGLRGSCSRQFCGHRRRGPVHSAGTGPQHRGHRWCHRLGLHRGRAGPTGRGSCAPVDNPWAQARGPRSRQAVVEGQVWLRITPAPSAGAAGDISVAVDKWQAVPRDRFPWTRRAPVHAADIAILPPLRAYQQGAAAIPASTQADLRELVSRVAARSLRIPLDIDPALERLPWEALLSHPVLTGESDVPGSLDFWRRGEPLPEAGPPPRPGHPSRVCVLADSTRRLFAERAALARDLSFLDLSASDGTDVNRTVERSGSLGPDPPDIVLGHRRLARAHGTVLLQVVERVSARGTSADELREAVVGGGLLEPEVVAGLRARLFIVLGAPTEFGQPLRHRTA